MTHTACRNGDWALLPRCEGCSLVGDWVPAPTPLLAYRGWVAGLPLPFIDATGALNVLRGRT